MATTRVETQFTANDRALRRSIAQLDTQIMRLAATSARASQQSAQSLNSIQGSISGLGASLKGMGATFAAAFSAREVIALADEFTRFESKLINAKVASSDMAQVQADLFATAKANGTEVTALADLYGNMAMSAKSLGLSQNDMMAATQGVAAAMRLSGSTTAQASATILQLGQALAGGTVRAEEYNSMLENAPALVRAVAESSTKWKGDLGALRKEINDGKVSSQEWANAIVAASAKLKSDAANAPLTVAAGLQNLRTSLVEYVGQADQSLGVSEKLGFALQMLGENIDLVANSLLVVSAFLASRAVGSMAAWTATTVTGAVANARYQATLLAMMAAQTGVTRTSLIASAAMDKLNASMAFFGGPIGLAITAVAAAIFGLATVAKNAEEDQKAYTEAMEASNEAMKMADEVLRKSAKGTKDVGDASSGAIAGVVGLCDATRALADETYRLADANAQAARTAIFKAVATNRERINELENPSLFRRGLYAAGTRHNGQLIQERDQREKESLYAANGDLMGRAIQLVTAPGARLIQGSPSTSGGAGGGKGGGGSKGAAVDIESNDERLLADARRRNIDALNALAETSDQRHGNALFMIDLEALEIEKAIKKQLADKKVSEAAATEALSLNENTRLEERKGEERRRALEIEQERADAAAEALAMEQSVAQLTQDTLKNRAAMAKTIRERHALEDAEFAIYQQAAKADFDARQAETRARLKNAQTLDDEAERRLAAEASAFGQMQSSERARREFDKRQDNPFAKFVDKAADLQSAFQNVAAEGLGSIENGLVDVMMRTQEMGEMFRNVSKQIIADLMRIAVQKMITAPIANFLGFGGGGGPNILSMFAGKPAAGGDNGGLISSMLNRHAIGTRFAPGGLSLVGEAGPELVNMPKGSQVMPTGDLKNLTASSSMMSRGAPVYNFTTVVNADDAVLAGQIRKEIREANVGAVMAANELTQEQMSESQRRGLRR
jgi:tape measure domain-containing protein